MKLQWQHLYCKLSNKYTYELIEILLYRTPDYGNALEAAQKIFDLINRKPMINNESKDGDDIVSAYHHVLQLYFSIYSLISPDNWNLIMFILSIRIDLNQLFLEILISILKLVFIVCFP